MKKNSNNRPPKRRKTIKSERKTHQSKPVTTELYGGGKMHTFNIPGIKGSFHMFTGPEPPPAYDIDGECIDVTARPALPSPNKGRKP